MASTICRRCKRPLTNLNSIQIGMGPTCAAKAGLQTSIMKEDPDVIMIPFEGDVICRREGHKKYMNIPQTIVNHSPTGLEWGYAGSGPADLALNILFMFTNDKHFAYSYHQEFKFAFVSGMDRDNAVIKGDDIRAWIEKKRKEATFVGQNKDTIVYQIN